MTGTRAGDPGDSGDLGYPGAERLASGYSGRMLGLVALGSMALFAGQLVLSPLLPTIVAALSITPTQAGVALSVMNGLVALSRFPGGRLADQLSRKTVIVAAYAIALAGFAVLAVATTYPVFVLGAAAVGIGGGLYGPAAIALLSDTFTERRGRALGVHEIAINLAGVAAGSLAVVAIVLPAWNAVFLPVMVALVAIAGLMHAWNADDYVVTASVALDLRGTGIRVFRDRRVVAMLVAFAIMAFVWQGMASFLTTFLRVEKGFAPALASNAFTGLFVVGIVANLVVTPLGDRFGYEPTAGVSAGVCGLGLGAAIVADGVPAVLAGVVLFGLGSASFWPLMLAAVLDALPADTVGGDWGIISMTFLGVGSLGPTYVGVVAERSSYAAAYAGFVLALVGVLAVVAWLARTR